MGVLNLNLKKISQKPINDCIATCEKSSSSFPPANKQFKGRNWYFLF